MTSSSYKYESYADVATLHMKNGYVKIVVNWQNVE